MNNLNKKPGIPEELENHSLVTVCASENMDCQMNSLLHIRELFQIIFKKLHPLYLVDCAVLLLYDEGMTRVRQSFISEYSQAIQDVVTETFPDEIKLESIFAEIAGFEFPVLKTRQEWEEDYASNHELLNNNSAYLFHCYIPLEKNNQILGTLELNNLNKALSTEGLSFCSNIADMFAEIIYLLINPERHIPEQDETPPQVEKINSEVLSNDLQLLLSLSNALAAIRNKEDLKSVIRNQFPFLRGINIATVNAGGETYSPFLFDTPTGVPGGQYAVKDGVFDEIAASADPIVFDIEELLKREFVPEYIQSWQVHGVAEFIGISLINGCELIGVLYLQIKDKKQIRSEQLKIFKAISSQISIALANVLIHQDIEQKNEEKAKLLSLTSELSEARKKDDVESIIDRHFKQFFDYDHITILLHNDSQKTYEKYLSFVKDINQFSKGSQLKQSLYTDDDLIIKALSAATLPVIFNVNSIVENNHLPGYGSFWQANSIVQIVGAPLHRGIEMIGVLLIHLSEERPSAAFDLSLLQFVASQISFAIANILAYEKINRQLEEITNYKQQLEDEKLYLQEEIQTNSNYAEIIGQGPEMQRVFQLLSQVAGTETTVLILGETGTGKELIARAIHNDSERKDKIMVKVNCAAIPANLIESELFGHEKGSFTGATERRIGKFELANNSTIFLDEIGDLPLDLQVKLLRVLQEKEIERVGGTTTIKTDVRIVSATNRDLREEVEAGRFRRDLFYRLNVFPVNLPPLRSRKDDIPLLADYFLNRYALKAGKKIAGYSQKALNEIRSYHWPGNVRELEHLVERQVLLTKGQMIREMEIPATARAILIMDNEITTVKTIDENERDHIFDILKLCNGKVSGADGAAKLLGVPATTLNSKIKRLGLTKTHLY